MANFTGSASSSIQGQLSIVQDIGEAVYSMPYSAQYIFTSGTGADQANNAISDKRTIAASSSENLDLSGSMVNALGATVSFTKIKVLQITADATNVNDVIFGGAASAQASSFFGAATDSSRVKPGGTVTMIAPNATGYPITATTADILKVANGGGGTPVSYTIFLIGVE